MLREISIENVAVIEKASVVFDADFNVLTGETGAGKSILIDSINAILGSRTSREIVRSGAEKARIWASFTHLDAAAQARLEAAGYPVEEELLLYREVAAEGKSLCRVNGQPATAGILRELCAGLVNIHGQHDNQSLMDPARHLALLDDFSGNIALLANYQLLYQELSAVREEMGRLNMDEAEKARRTDLLRYELEEIETAHLRQGEEEELANQRRVIQNAQTIAGALNAAYLALGGGDEDIGAGTLLGRAAGELSSVAEYALELGELSNKIEELHYSVRDLSSDIYGRLNDYEFNPRALEEVEQRLDTLYRLKQKYGRNVEEVLAYAQRAKEEMAGIEFAEERLAELERRRAALTEQAQKAAQGLTESRLAAFEKLRGQTADALAFLNMPGIQFELRHQVVPLGADGADEVEFYISTNPGETPKPLAKIASGGELARIMLAIKSALAERDAVATVIYDEIDTGISGQAAGRIGRMLRDTARGRQVICVTHTAQIAAYAARHLLIEKEVEAGRTFTHIRQLTAEERAEELARIIAGDHITEKARASAKELLELAGEGRAP